MLACYITARRGTGLEMKYILKNDGYVLLLGLIVIVLVIHIDRYLVFL
jgi:hypothetical protein